MSSTFHVLIAVSVLSAFQSTSPLTGKAPSATVVSCEENSGCTHEFIDGLKYKILTTDKAVITAALTTNGKFARANISVLNKANSSIDVLPEKFTIDENDPKKRMLGFVPPEKIVKADAHRAGWANALNAFGAGMARQQVTSQTQSNGTVNVNSSDGTEANGTYNGSSTTTTSVPDYAAQAQARENIRRRREAIAAERQAMEQTSLKANTVQSNQSIAGFVYFEWDKKAQNVALMIPIDGVIYRIPFTFEKR